MATTTTTATGQVTEPTYNPAVLQYIGTDPEYQRTLFNIGQVEAVNKAGDILNTRNINQNWALATKETQRQGTEDLNKNAGNFSYRGMLRSSYYGKSKGKIQDAVNRRLDTLNLQKEDAFAQQRQQQLQNNTTLALKRSDARASAALRRAQTMGLSNPYK